MDRAHDLKAALSFHDHPLAKQALERIAELEAALRRINAMNDSPARFSKELQDVLNSVIDTSDTRFDQTQV